MICKDYLISSLCSPSLDQSLLFYSIRYLFLNIWIRILLHLQDMKTILCPYHQNSQCNISCPSKEQHLSMVNHRLLNLSWILSHYWNNPSTHRSCFRSNLCIGHSFVFCSNRRYSNHLEDFLVPIDSNYLLNLTFYYN